MNLKEEYDKAFDQVDDDIIEALEAENDQLDEVPF
jgi:hypothetical protein